jgi:hypothetical protein
MTGAGYIDRITSELWPQNAASAAPMWAILDAASDERITGALEKSGLDFYSLFPGRLAPEMKAAVPYLVKLRFGHPFLHYIITEGWDHHWGVILQAEGSIEELRLHLKGLMRVRDEDGNRLLFRFYDPRVMRIYLPTCTARELKTFYGPVSRYVLEDEAPGSLIEFSLENRELKQRKVVLLQQQEPGARSQKPE